MSNKGERVIRRLFLLIPIVSIILISITIAMVIFMIQGEWRLRDISTLYARSPFIFQSFINLIVLWMIAFLGASLFSDKKPKTRKGNYTFFLLSLFLAFLLHPMVYGIAWFLPVTYSLFGPYNKAMIIFAAPFSNNLTLFESIVFHIFTPQVILGLVVSAIALKRALSK